MIVASSIGLGEIQLDGTDVYWLETRPQEGRSHTAAVISAVLRAKPKRASAMSSMKCLAILCPSADGANEYDGSGRRPCDGRQEARHQGLEICEPVGPGLKHDNGNRERDKVLLKGQIPIYRYEYIKFVRRQGKQFPVFDRSPTNLTGCLDVMGGQLACETPIDTFVQEHLHQAASISRSFACSRKAMTCARVTDGKPSRKASTVSPASR
jgi:hypothetical protein